MATIRALRFKQWIQDWDTLKFDASEFRRRPAPHIYLFSMPADQLRALSGVFRRQRHDGVATGIQRGHDKERSKQIRDFVRFGYPYSEMSSARRESFDSDDLRKPGWLPTAIVVNILTGEDTRRGKTVSQGDLIAVTGDENAEITLPSTFTDSTWEPSDLPPLEIIDGQHRLYAFDLEALPGDFELPVVAFVGLDIGWQAYLFWSINVSPKKINPSHAFDLYPLLRSQDWLEKFAESNVYREARAQELTEFLFRHPQSPWRNRINMLGERGIGGVSQAAWIRSLSSTFLAAGRGKGTKGLFGCSITDTSGPLPWTRPQQAAFLMHIWEECRMAIKESDADWCKALRAPDKRQKNLLLNEAADLAFVGPNSMLSQEQGVRGLLAITNDLFFMYAQELCLADWEVGDNRGVSTADEDITEALLSLKEQALITFTTSLFSLVAKYDWRSADASDLDYEQKLKRRAFRGSGGYAALRDDLLLWLKSGEGLIAEGASRLLLARQ